MSNNRRRGHNWERKCASLLRDIGYDEVKTCREESLSRDALGIDLCNISDFNVQCKTFSTPIHPDKILNKMPDEEGRVNVIFYKKTEKAGKRFMTKGEYAILHLEDFLQIIWEMKKLQSSMETV
jgi:hypothetical protein